MHYLIVKHRVADFAQWQRVFEEHGPAARRGGLELLHVLRDMADPQEEGSGVHSSRRCGGLCNAGDGHRDARRLVAE